MQRRALITATGAAVVAGTAGCLGVITGEEPAEFEATPSSVSASALEETGYEDAGVEDVVVEEEVEAAGQSREVVVTNYQAEYEKAIDLGPLGQQRAAVFVSLTSPQVSVLGQEFNPIAEMTTEEIAEMVQDNYEGLQNLQHREDGEVTVAGETTTRSTFTAEATIEGGSVDLLVHVSEAVELDDDFVVTVGAHPEAVSGEAENVFTLMEAVQSGR
ncbi:MAG: DUF6517 family protein [Haloferacaceae archaeon]